MQQAPSVSASLSSFLEVPGEDNASSISENSSRSSRTSSLSSTSTTESEITEIPANVLKDKIIDNAILALRGRGYDIRDNKAEKAVSGHDRIRPDHENDLKEGMRNKLHDKLVSGLDDAYVQSDYAAIEIRVAEFLYKNASSISPKQSRYSEKDLEKFRQDVLEARQAVYQSAQDNNHVEAWDVLKNSSVKDVDLAKTVKSIGDEINGLDDDYRAANQYAIKNAIERVPTEGIAKVRGNIRAASQMESPVLAEVFGNLSGSLTTKETQDIANILNGTLANYNTAFEVSENKAIVVNELSRIITEKRGRLGNSVNDTETLGLMFEAAEGLGLIATNPVFGAIHDKLMTDFRGKNAKLKGSRLAWG